MRSGDPGFEVTPDGRDGSWNIGREAGQAWPKQGWGTDFSCFRMAIPELAGFTGRHIYLDADMLVRSDIGELFDLPAEKAFLCLSNARTDVSVIDAASCMFEQWPTLAQIKSRRARMYDWVQFLLRHNLIDPNLPDYWNACDPHRPSPDPGLRDAKLLHFTTVPTQPWHPYKTVTYRAHPWQSWVREWQRYQQEIA